MVRQTQNLFIGNFDGETRVHFFVRLRCFRWDPASQTKHLQNFDGRSHNLSLAIFMLGSFVIKEEKHSKEGRHLLANVVREGSEGGDEEPVGNQASLFGQRSPVTSLLPNSLDLHHLVQLYRPVPRFQSDQSVPLDQLIGIDRFVVTFVRQPEDDVGGGEREGGVGGGGDLQHQGGGGRRSG